MNPSKYCEVIQRVPPLLLIFGFFLRKYSFTFKEILIYSNSILYTEFEYNIYFYISPKNYIYEPFATNIIIAEIRLYTKPRCTAGLFKKLSNKSICECELFH